MAGRSNTTFQKRQKELARQEKQKDKAAKRAQRTSTPGGPPIEAFDPTSVGLPPDPEPVRQG